jgi:hypothetical protein
VGVVLVSRWAPPLMTVRKHPVPPLLP